MKLIIKSKQDYKTHMDEYKEEFECTLEKEEGRIRINFDEGFIQIEEKKIIYERGTNKIIIEPNKVNECDYETQYGMFVLDIKGKEVISYINENIQNNEGLLVAKAKYEIQMVGVESYENNIEILII